MLIATVPYVGKRLHLDPDPKLITDPDPNMQIISDPAGSGSTTLTTALYYHHRFIFKHCRRSNINHSFPPKEKFLQ
jgi:hypothetical protein